MKTALALLAVSTALTAAIALPAWSAVQSLGTADPRPLAAVLDAGPEAAPVVLASDDDDDDDDDRRRSGRGRDDDDDDDDDDDGGDRRAVMPDPAPAGPVAPPANGLFGTGAPPRVQVN